MSHTNNQTPNLKNSKAVGQGEREKVKRKINNPKNTTQMNFTNSIGSVPNLSTSNAVENAEMEKVKRRIRESQNKNFQNPGLK
ncbi:hypothetical protein GOQ29_03895 [Clostridium sp. D2Q-14]|uniref:hypothetical protein n=1 Tax=Anaeromonas gelatinilytica TaxID=2683194 RepID=UPI00193BA6BA|nr:hypothetical protein [Anaeromonas gelatinilytica]MBS4534755.1 hypothetical protein [Anaeromonas gelatinilytica]